MLNIDRFKSFNDANGRPLGDEVLIQVAKILNMRYTPDLLFFFDNRNEEVQRIDDLFRQIEKERNDEPS